MSNFFRADLHCHSTHSDGSLSPTELIKLACEKNLQGLSITDHDSIAAYSETLIAAKKENLLMISGVELSAMHQESSVHILAYSFSVNSAPMLNFCARHHQRRLLRIHTILDSLAKNNIFITKEDLSNEIHTANAHHSIGRPHIAAAMVRKGYASNFQEAFRNYLGEGQKCYIAGDAFSVEETLAVIHESKGLAVIAHPHLIKKTHVLRDLLQMNFDGIEGYYARFPKSEQERWVKIGARKGWIVTGGSDFHGEMKENNSLGSSWVNEETFSALSQHFQNNQGPISPL